MAVTTPVTDLTCDVFIGGGGPPGLMLAALLGQAGLRVVLADKSPLGKINSDPHRASIDTPNSDVADVTVTAEAPPNGKTTALLMRSLAVLRAVGVWPQLEAQSGPLWQMRIIDDSNRARHSARIEFDALLAGDQPFGYNIPNQLLRTALCGRLAALESVTLVPDVAVVGVSTHPGYATATLDDGRCIQAALIVAADGKNSAVRSAAGIGVRRWGYGQSALVCQIAHDAPHEGVSTEFHRAGGPFTLVPLPGDRSSLVWVEATADAERLHRLDDGAFTRVLQRQTHGVLGAVRLEGARGLWPLEALLAHRFHAARVALIAEAAHAVSPLGAQGMNLSLRDVAALAEMLVDRARLGLDIGAADMLAAYTARRRPDVIARVVGVEGLNHITTSTSPPLCRLRQATMQLLDKAWPLRRLAIECGSRGFLDDARLLRGEQL